MAGLPARLHRCRYRRAGSRGWRPPPAAHRLRQLLGWLDYAVDLGASGLAPGPVFASGTHGHDTIDHYRIDPRLGDEADFAALVDAAHARGLRVLLDGVFNHVSGAGRTRGGLVPAGLAGRLAAW